jgi:mono/diheme cytochrome c family protein
MMHSTSKAKEAGPENKPPRRPLCTRHRKNAVIMHSCYSSARRPGGRFVSAKRKILEPARWRPGIGPAKEDIMHPAHLENHKSRILRLSVATAFLFALAAATYASAQSTTVTVTAKTAPKIEKTRIKYVSPASGKQMYDEYCAVCHGANAKGNGPAAAVLVPRPTDLTSLTSRNGGSFPKHQVRYLLTDQDFYHDQAGRDMPTWGPALKSLDKTHPDILGLRVHNLMAYLETMQAPAVSAGSDPR